MSTFLHDDRHIQKITWIAKDYKNGKSFPSGKSTESEEDLFPGEGLRTTEMIMVTRIPLYTCGKPDNRLDSMELGGGGGDGVVENTTVHIKI